MVKIYSLKVQAVDDTITTSQMFTSKKWADAYFYKAVKEAQNMPHISSIWIETSEVNQSGHIVRNLLPRWKKSKDVNKE